MDDKIPGVHPDSSTGPSKREELVGVGLMYCVFIVVFGYVSACDTRKADLARIDGFRQKGLPELAALLADSEVRCSAAFVISEIGTLQASNAPGVFRLRSMALDGSLFSGCYTPDRCCSVFKWSAQRTVASDALHRIGIDYRALGPDLPHFSDSTGPTRATTDCSVAVEVAEIVESMKRKGLVDDGHAWRYSPPPYWCLPPQRDWQSEWSLGPVRSGPSRLHFLGEALRRKFPGP
jgi:hypothetical protein